jgi:DNA-directed RNA polymerase subunit N (RpoN/RPB10)
MNWETICGEVIGNNLWNACLALLFEDTSESFLKILNADGASSDVLELKHYCYRRMFLTCVDLIEKLLPFLSPLFEFSCADWWGRS